ncbi:MAG: hypothetical protein MZW92_40785 [Comamonadaceae bacterium]|nr:hypothetical protein [Comamonadaceae bacterium]
MGARPAVASGTAVSRRGPPAERPDHGRLRGGCVREPRGTARLSGAGPGAGRCPAALVVAGADGPLAGGWRAVEGRGRAARRRARAAARGDRAAARVG